MNELRMVVRELLRGRGVSFVFDDVTGKVVEDADATEASDGLLTRAADLCSGRDGGEVFVESGP